MFDNIKSDINRLSIGEGAGRNLTRGLLSQGFQAILVYRFFHWLDKFGITGQPIRFFVERFIEITTGISIPAECIIGKGIRIHHFGGIVFHPSVVIGDNCTLYHGVTIGDAGGYGKAARIGDNVMIGTGAKLIGEINVGNGCKIGANAVVDRDLPEYSTCYGNPCIIKTKTPK